MRSSTLGFVGHFLAFYITLRLIVPRQVYPAWRPNLSSAHMRGARVPIQGRTFSRSHCFERAFHYERPDLG